MKEQRYTNQPANAIEKAVEETDISSSQYRGTGSLKFGTGFPETIAGKDCWFVPGFGFYTEEGKYLGETKDEVTKKLVKDS